MLYTVATTGSNANSGTPLEPFQTITYGITVLQPEDILQVRGGLYPESLEASNDVFIPRGLPNRPVTITAAPGEPVVLCPPTGALRVIDLEYNRHQGTETENITFAGLTFDAVHVAIDGMQCGNRTNHILFQDCTMKNAPSSGFTWGPDCDFMQLVRCDVHDCGMLEWPASELYGYAVYISGKDCLVDGCTFYNIGGYGVHASNSYTQDSGHNTRNDRVIVRNSTIFKTGIASVPDPGFWSGILITSGDDCQVYNNVCHTNKYAGIRVAYQANRTLVMNNTSVGNAGNPWGGFGMAVDNGPTGTQLVNNICVDNAIAPVFNDSPDTIERATWTTNPLFVDPAAYNFHLRPDSPAIGHAGDLSPLFQTDMNHYPRASRWDPGACQFHRMYPVVVGGIKTQV